MSLATYIMVYMLCIVKLIAMCSVIWPSDCYFPARGLILKILF